MSISLWQIILIVLGLNMDTLAISSSVALYHSRITPRLVFRIAFHFALFQAGLLLFGWSIGSVADRYFANYDHWIAAALLWIIGLKMIYESFHSDGEVKTDPSRGLSLVILSVATSLDALAVGGSLAFLNVHIVQTVIIAWLLTVCVSSTGLFIGKRVGTMCGKRAELVGGIVLCLIGFKILFSHLGE